MLLCGIYVELMQKRADDNKRQCPGTGICKFYDFMPPAKATLPKSVLKSEVLRSGNMGIRTSFVFE